MFWHFRNVSFENINVDSEIPFLFCEVVSGRGASMQSKKTTLSVHLNGSVHDKLFTQTALYKWLCRWRSSSSAWASFVWFFKYISFNVVKISSVSSALLSHPVFWPASLCELAEMGPMETLFLFYHFVFLDFSQQLW